MLLRGDLLFLCGLSPLSLLITGQRSDKNCLLGNRVGGTGGGGGGESPDDRTAGRGRQRGSS